MKLPIKPKTIIDVTKPPYCADNTGKVDCTDILRKVFDDILIREIEAREETKKKILDLAGEEKEDTYVGIESGRMEDGKLFLTFPEYLPPTRIIYFPNGVYLVNNTITYTLENLKSFDYSVPYYETCRNIHIYGEDKEKTIIKLADFADGFNTGEQKPLISFINNEEPLPRNQEVANAAFMNIIKDITLDCGNGNPDVVGIKYISSNIGRIENVDIKTQEGKSGIYTYLGTQGVFENIRISGFDYGMDIAHSAMMVLNKIDISDNKKAGIYEMIR